MVYEGGSSSGCRIPLTDSADEDSSMLSSKRAKLLEEEDRLSALPDSMLLHILSFLDLKEVVRTCVLSTRWEFLWLDSSELDFCDNNKEIEKIHSFVERVSKILVICSGIHLKKFRVNFTYKDCFASNVDLWLHFVVKNKVNDVGLNFCTINSEFYKLPQVMYSNSSLINLSLRKCIVAPSGTIEWKSLTSLSLAQVELSLTVMGIILTGCPVLESLNLRACWGSSLLDIDTRSLVKVVIVNWKGISLEIFAPYVKLLQITGSSKGEDCRAFQLSNISSLVKANLDFIEPNFEIKHTEASFEEAVNSMKEIFTSLQHVEELKLGHWLVKVLSVLTGKGWHLPQYSCKSLTLIVHRNAQSIHGITSLLESSPNLETLVINGTRGAGFETLFNYGPDPDASYLEKGDLNCDLLQLKTVKLASLVNPYSGGDEPMLKLVQMLLKSAKVLEKMVIDVKGFAITRLGLAPGLYLNIAELLLGYPRSSPNAVIQFCY